ncbi:PucR family transcriptional regulator [Nocardia jejuensis]|uniref:PucR family transcriptional regulator n=1 Tax=Nocardia jejuensis TaxID=328049 RepID=UPI0008372DA4|nr:helix-turn-helix domain-containing protein [Nocardia jejuensis]
MCAAPAPALSSSPSLVARMRTRWPQIAQRMFDAGLGRTASDADLPPEHFAAEVLPTIHACGHAVLHAVGEGREYTRAEVAEFVVPVAERHAEDRFPLPTLLAAMHQSAKYVLAEVLSLAEPTEAAERDFVISRLMDFLMHTNIVVVETYTEVQHSVHNAAREARRELCSALLRGLAANELAARADTSLADRYTPLAIHISPEATSAASLLAHRRIRVLHRMLDRLTDSTTLATFDGFTGIVLIPSTDSADPDLARYRTLAAELAEQFGTKAYVGQGRAVLRAGLPAASEEATELAALARLLGRPSGYYRLDDLVLEFQLTRPGPARDNLADRISPLLPKPHLLEALEAHLRHGSDRKSAAAELQVHPNTFTYRLRRVCELTGVDPTDPANSRLLAAALTIHRLFPLATGAGEPEPS